MIYNGLLYDDKFLSQFGEDKVEAFLLSNKTIKMSTHDEDESRLIYALENYIVKYHRKPKSLELGNRMEKIKASLLGLFSAMPSVSNYSYILSRWDVMRDVYPNKFSVVKNALNSLYVDIDRIYNDLMNDRAVSDNERARILTCFMRKMSYGVDRKQNKRYFDMMDAYFYKLLLKNEIPTNDDDLLFIFNYASNYLYRQKGKKDYKVNYRLVDIKDNSGSFTGGYQSNAFIAMNDKQCPWSTFYHSLDQMLQCGIHEAEHSIQQIEAINNKGSIAALEMVIHRLFGKDEYQTGDNYLFNELEEDANRMGYYYARILYFMAGNKAVYEKLHQEDRAFFTNRRFQYEYVTVRENGTTKTISKAKYNVEKLREVVKNNPGLVSEYPVLTNLFNSSGDAKSLDQMLSEDYKSNDITKMYYDFILYDLRNGKLSSIDFDSKSDKEKKNIISKLCSILRDEVDYVIAILKDVQYRKQEDKKSDYFFDDGKYKMKKVPFFMFYHLKNILTISKFLEPYLGFMREYDRNNPGVHLQAGYTTEVRSLLNNIELAEREDRILELKNVLVGFKPHLDKMDSNVIDEYLSYILGHFTEKEQNTLISYNNRSMTLTDFVMVEVKKHMDRDHNLISDDGKYITDKNGDYIFPVDFVRDVFNRLKQSQPGDNINSVFKM